MGRADMAADERLASNAGRVRQQPDIDEAITTWTGSMECAAALAALEQARAAARPINSVADMLVDPHFNARGLFEQVEVNGKPLKIPAMVPKLSATPGRTEWPGPEVGAFNDAMYGELLGLTAADLDRLRRDGVV